MIPAGSRVGSGTLKPGVSPAGAATVILPLRGRPAGAPKRPRTGWAAGGRGTGRGSDLGRDRGRDLGRDVVGGTGGIGATVVGGTGVAGEPGKGRGGAGSGAGTGRGMSRGALRGSWRAAGRAGSGGWPVAAGAVVAAAGTLYARTPAMIIPARKKT
ncbi:hypothetical protein GCM10017559_71040 [Streptosporangium longisporum]|uniref:Uncharacterized protein n=1 Tax=Streptosporangium longisporum TaxID=46187 RepID=A0ABP6L8B8_9ACTN